MRGLFEKAITWTRSLQGRMQIWLPPIGELLWEVDSGPRLQRIWAIAPQRRLSWREGLEPKPSLP
jgi:hypothetical protein